MLNIHADLDRIPVLSLGASIRSSAHWLAVLRFELRGDHTWNMKITY